MSFLLSIISGIVTMLGYFFKRNNYKFLTNVLGLSSGVMIGVCLFDLLPSSVRLFNSNVFLTIIYMLIFIVLGIFVDISFDKKLDCDIKSIGILTVFAIIIHNIPEGIITYISSSNNLTLGIDLTISIAIHNITEGIAIATPIYYSTNSKIKTLSCLLIASLSEPFGAVITHLFLKNYINDFILAALFSFTIGIMLYIALFKLIKFKNSIHFFIMGVILILFKNLF